MSSRFCQIPRTGKLLNPTGLQGFEFLPTHGLLKNLLLPLYFRGNASTSYLKKPQQKIRQNIAAGNFIIRITLLLLYLVCSRMQTMNYSFHGFFGAIYSKYLSLFLTKVYILFAVMQIFFVEKLQRLHRKKGKNFFVCTTYTPLQNVLSGSKSAVTFALIKILTHPC